MPDELAGGDLTVVHVLGLNNVPLIRVTVRWQWSPWSPEADYPEDMLALAYSLEKALKVQCTYHDLRKPKSKPTSLTMPGVKLRT
jgi:hypothetical protein